MLAAMADPVTHFVDTEESVQPTRTPCGVPIKDGQIFLRGRALSATTVPSAVTCDGCSVRADEVAKIRADREKAEQETAADAARQAEVAKARALLGLPPEGGS